MIIHRQAQVHGFTIGICASDSAAWLPGLLRFLASEDYGQAHALSRIVVVASGCPEPVLASARLVAESDSRILLVVEDRRHGKAEAINRILRSTSSEYLVMLNADACPASGAIRGLLEVAADPTVGAVSAEPVFEERGGLLRRSLALMWSVHNQMSVRLNHEGLSNHACDELLLVRGNLVSGLPSNVVNDGAYIGGLVQSRGFRVKVSPGSKVRIAVPHRAIDLIQQRRRIIFGHVQVWKRLGRPPRTLESMLFVDPLSSLGTLVGVLSKSPRFIPAIPLVLTGELISVLLGLYDVVTSTSTHAVWRRNAQ
jgi:cellulose synthase/poly-beta-1,6-N-acetylglucosamine synthase-like glycosyltransferase